MQKKHKFQAILFRRIHRLPAHLKSATRMAEQPAFFFFFCYDKQPGSHKIPLGVHAVFPVAKIRYFPIGNLSQIRCNTTHLRITYSFLGNPKWRGETVEWNFFFHAKLHNNVPFRPEISKRYYLRTHFLFNLHMKFTNI